MKIMRPVMNIFSGILPPAKLFRLKKYLYKIAGINVGLNVKITSRTKIYGGGDVVLGKNSWLGIAVEFYVPDYSAVRIGENCDIAPKVLFICGSHIVGNTNRRAGKGLVGRIQVDDGVWIGCGAILLPDVFIGSGSVVAAGAVVKAGIYPPNSLVAGNPAVVKKIYE